MNKYLDLKKKSAAGLMYLCAISAVWKNYGIDICDAEELSQMDEYDRYSPFEGHEPYCKVFNFKDSPYYHIVIDMSDVPTALLLLLKVFLSILYVIFWVYTFKDFRGVTIDDVINVVITYEDELSASLLNNGD